MDPAPCGRVGVGGTHTAQGWGLASAGRRPRGERPPSEPSARRVWSLNRRAPGYSENHGLARQETPEQNRVRPRETVLFGRWALGPPLPPSGFGSFCRPWAAAGPPLARYRTAACRGPPGRLGSLRPAHWDRGEGGLSRESRVLHGIRRVLQSRWARTVVRLTPRAPVGSCQLPAGTRRREPSPGGWTPRKPVISRARRPQSGTEQGSRSPLEARGEAPSSLFTSGASGGPRRLSLVLSLALARRVGWSASQWPLEG